MIQRRLLAVSVIGLLLAACSDDGGGAVPTTEAAAGTTAVGSDLAPATFTVQPGTSQIAAIGLEPGTEVNAVAPDGTVVETKAADEQGAVLFRELLPAEGWRLTTATETTDELSVMSPTDTPPESLYTEEQTLLPAEASATSSPATAPHSAPMWCCPGPPPTGRTPPSWSTAATRRATPTTPPSPSSTPRRASPMWA